MVINAARIDPEVRVVAGDPTPEEVAAVVAVLAAGAGRESGPPTPAGTGWSGYWRSVRTPSRTTDDR